MTRSEKMAVWTEAFMRKVNWDFGDMEEGDYIAMGELWWRMFPEYKQWGVA
jgi:hypothetical protein